MYVPTFLMDWLVPPTKLPNHLFTSRLMNHLSEATDVLNQQCTTLAFDHAHLGEPIQLAGYSLAMSADATRNIGMRR